VESEGGLSTAQVSPATSLKRRRYDGDECDDVEGLVLSEIAIVNGEDAIVEGEHEAESESGSESCTTRARKKQKPAVAVSEVKQRGRATDRVGGSSVKRKGGRMKKV